MPATGAARFLIRHLFTVTRATMSIVKEAVRKISGCLYLALGNRFTDRLFWQAVEARSGHVQNLACMLRHYQIEALHYLESRIDNDVLDDLRNRLKPLISYFRRKSNVTSHTSAHFEDAGMHASLGSFPYSTSLYKPVKAQLKKYPTISLVTPNYNQGKFLEKCIRSVLSQNYPHLEYIIIDGGSTDNSVEIIKKYENKLTYWVSEKDDGQADAINKGLKHVTGNIFNWLNSDDYFEPGALLKCAEAYEKEPSAVGWVGGCRRIDSNGRVLTVIYPNGMDRENIGQNWNGRQFYQPSCFLSTKRVKEVGGLNPDLYIALDLDLWIRILENGKFFASKGIWSNAIIHTDAKTQERERVLLETVDVQRKHGFLDGANIRYKCVFKKGKFRYVPPTLLKDRSKWMENSSKINTDIFKKPTTITFISDILPCYNRGFSRHRLLTILRTLLANKCAINYIYISNDKCHEKYLNAFKGDINLYHVSSNHEDSERIISENKTEYVWITTSNNINHIKLTNKIAERLKAKRTNFKMLIDAAHAYNGGYLKNHDSDTSEREFIDENEFFENTKMLFEIADKLIVSNPREKRDIEEKIGIKREIGIIPNVYKVLATGFPYDKRRHICFIADFDVNHNIDAVRYFIDNIFAFVLRRNPHVEFHIVGSDSARCGKEFKLPNVKMIGNVRNLERLLENYRLCVFPIAYQAGVNDGIGIAAGAGLPIVTTSINAEDYPVKDGEECFIADLPLEFAEKCNHCLRDSITWHNFRMKSQLMIAENYSPQVVARKLAEVLDMN